MTEQEREPFPQLRGDRLIQAAKDIANFVFPRRGLNVIQASDRVAELVRVEEVVETLPPSFHDVDTLQVELPLIHHTADHFVMNRDEHDLGWDK